MEASELEPLLDMMQEFNDLEDIPWSRQEVKPAVERLLGAPELGLIAHIIERVPAILTAYFAGPHQGEALADAIFGITNPAGKLPYTLPRHVGQVPIHHGQRTGSGYHRTG